MDTFCDCYYYKIIDMKSNVNNRKYVCLKFVIVDSRIYNIVALQFQWRGAFSDKVVPFRLNKFIYYTMLACFILNWC